MISSINHFNNCMDMRKLYMLLAMVAIFFMAPQMNAQSRKFTSKRNMEVSAGYSNLSTSSAIGASALASNLHGFYVSYAYDYSLLKEGWGRLALVPGLRFTYAEDVEAEKNWAVLEKTALKESYLEVPIHVKYSYKFNYMALSAFVGPEFSVGLSSTSYLFSDKYMFKYYNYSGTEVFKGATPTETVVPNNVSDYSRYDVKCTFGVGSVFMDRFTLKVSYSLGLLNRYKGEPVLGNKLIRKTNVLNVGLGYRF